MGTASRKTIQIYCDGACLNNPGPGGWAALLVSTLNNKHYEKTVKGRAKETTNNRMELSAIIHALKALKQPSNVSVYPDSQYVKKGMETWIHQWKKNNFKSASGKPIKNVDLWTELDVATQPHHIQWHWVKGHSGHPENERVDELARAEAEKAKEEKGWMRCVTS